jgi:hypothetical protein
MRRWALLALLLLCVPSVTGASEPAHPWQAFAVEAPAPVEALLRRGSGIYADFGAGGAGGARYHRVHLEGGRVVLEALPDFLIAPDPHRPDMLPDGIVALGEQDVQEAWLAGPTQRYRHGVLGDGFEATTLVAVDDLQRQHRLELSADSVFEDRFPRLADLDGDGTDEIVVVRSTLEKGAAIAVYGLGPGSLERRAESPPIGRPQRWLNPAGIADLDGDGQLEIAVVLTPHIGGILAVYRLEESGLVELARLAGFSNHAIGTRELGLAAVVDLDGDGVDDLALPDAMRRALRLVTFKDGAFGDLGTVEHDRAIVSAIHAADVDGDGAAELVYIVDNRTVVVLKR